ncbi:hypothetical protein CSAL01_07447 [Colletotrichum salicis]|uniref:Uncharacterized protein n=1 Tax=Colletotrichum salicis TaxID=1209931 RepID=A0A135U6Q2_9PEZI|nr:hypothetical protein CSAL01_07447 [Colletotrichum salicis]
MANVLKGIRSSDSSSNFERVPIIIIPSIPLTSSETSVIFTSESSPERSTLCGTPVPSTTLGFAVPSMCRPPPCSAAERALLHKELDKFLSRTEPDFQASLFNRRNLHFEFHSCPRRNMASPAINGWLGDPGEIDFTERFDLIKKTRSTLLGHPMVKKDKDMTKTFGSEEAWGHFVGAVLGPPMEWEKVRANVILRSNAARTATASRDLHICPFCLSNHGQKCHIAPFWTFNRPGSAKPTTAAMTVYGNERMARLKEKLVDRDTNIVDTSANIITLTRLSPLRRRQEDKARHFGSHIVEEAEEPTNEPIGLRVRSHWLLATEHLTPETIPRNLTELRRTWSPWNRRNAINDINARFLDNHTVIDIFNTKDAKAPDFDIVPFQWDVFRMHALAGGADPAIYSPNFYEDPDGKMTNEAPPEKVQALQDREAGQARIIQEAEEVEETARLRMTQGDRAALRATDITGGPNIEASLQRKPSRLTRFGSMRSIFKPGSPSPTTVTRQQNPDTAEGSNATASLQRKSSIASGMKTVGRAAGRTWGHVKDQTKKLTQRPSLTLRSKKEGDRQRQAPEQTSDNRTLAKVPYNEPATATASPSFH